MAVGLSWGRSWSPDSRFHRPGTHYTSAIPAPGTPALALPFVPDVAPTSSRRGKHPPCAGKVPNLPDPAPWPALPVPSSKGPECQRPPPHLPSADGAAKRSGSDRTVESRRDRPQPERQLPGRRDPPPSGRRIPERIPLSHAVQGTPAALQL